jgi:hypothetical protein
VKIGSTQPHKANPESQGMTHQTSKPTPGDPISATRSAATWLLIAAFALSPASLGVTQPTWWSLRGVIDPQADANDYGLANIGQLKHFATMARDDFDANLPGGAGNAIDALVDSWYDSVTGEPLSPNPPDQNLAPINLGQLKAVSKPYYDRLIALNLLPAGAHPWTATTTDDANYAPATIGQLKNVFNFDAAALIAASNIDTDGDGLPDVWEIANGLNPLSAADVNDDPDNDDLTNLQEHQLGTDPNKTDTDSDGLPDGIDPNPKVAGPVDVDNDGSTNAEEIVLGTDPLNPDTDADGAYDGYDSVPLDDVLTFPKSGMASKYLFMPLGEGLLRDFNNFGDVLILRDSMFQVLTPSGFIPLNTSSIEQIEGYIAHGVYGLAGPGQVWGSVFKQVGIFGFGSFPYVANIAGGADVLTSSQRTQAVPTTGETTIYCIPRFADISGNLYGGEEALGAVLETGVKGPGLDDEGYMLRQKFYYGSVTAWSGVPSPNLPVELQRLAATGTLGMQSAWETDHDDVPVGIVVPEEIDLDRVRFSAASDGGTFLLGKSVQKWTGQEIWKGQSEGPPVDYTASDSEGDVVYNLISELDSEVGEYLVSNAFGAGVGMPFQEASIPWSINDMAESESPNERGFTSGPMVVFDNGKVYVSHNGNWKHTKLKESGNEITKGGQINDRGQVLYTGENDFSIWSDGKLHTQSELVDAESIEWETIQQMQFTDNGAIAFEYHKAGSFTPFVGLLVPVNLVDTKDQLFDDLAPQGTTVTAAMRDVNIEPKATVEVQKERSIAWIEPHGEDNGNNGPDMPQLALRFRGSEQMGLKIKWKLEIIYDRPRGTKPNKAQIKAQDEVFIPKKASGTQPRKEEVLVGAIELFNHADWIAALQEKGFFGGEAKLTYQLLKADGSALATESTILFSIGGKNPEDGLAKDYIDAQATAADARLTRLSYAVGRHESKGYNGADSRYNQFWEGYARRFRHDHKRGHPLWCKAPPESSAGGFGIFQITGNVSNQYAIIPREQMWNWQKNTDAYITIIKTGGTAAKGSVMDRFIAGVTNTYPSDTEAQNPPTNFAYDGGTYDAWEPSPFTMALAAVRKAFSKAHQEKFLSRLTHGSFSHQAQQDHAGDITRIATTTFMRS